MRPHDRDHRKGPAQSRGDPVALQGLALTLLIGTEVFFRYIVGRALSWPEEVAGIFFVWFTFLGVVLLTQSGEHIEFNFLAQRLSSRASKVLSVFIQVMIGLYALFHQSVRIYLCGHVSI